MSIHDLGLTVHKGDPSDGHGDGPGRPICSANWNRARDTSRRYACTDDWERVTCGRCKRMRASYERRAQVGRS